MESISVLERRLRIAVFHDLPSGGAKRALYEFCRELTERLHVVDAFMPETADEKYLPLDNVVSSKFVYPLKRHKLRVRLETRDDTVARAADLVSCLVDQAECQKSIAGDINDGCYDVAFVHHSFISQAPFVMKYLSIPSLYYMQEPFRTGYEAPFADDCPAPPSLSVRCWRAIIINVEKRNIVFADRILSNSYYSHESILRAFGINSYVCYLGVNTSRFCPDASKCREGFVMSVGGLNANKGFRFLIRTLARIEAADRPPLLLICDRGEPELVEQLKHEAAKRDVDVKIKLGIPDQELRTLYCRAGVVVYAPYLEPFGLIPLEAMACATPVIGIREGGVRETVMHGVTGLLVDRDEEMWAEAINALLADTVRREEMGRCGRELVEQKWTWRRSCDTLLRHIGILTG